MPEPLDPSIWMRPCTRCRGPRDARDLGNGRCAACRAETGEAWPPLDRAAIALDSRSTTT